jgi:hypothetical protein
MNFVTRAEQFTSDLFLRGVREKGRRALGPGMRSANGGAWQENDDIVASSFPTSYLRRIGLRDRGVIPQVSYAHHRFQLIAAHQPLAQSALEA